MIDLQELASVLNKHGITCHVRESTALVTDKHEFIELTEEYACYIDLTDPDHQNAPATTLIREALVRDGFRVYHFHDSTGHFCHAVKEAQDNVRAAGQFAPMETYTESLLSVCLEVWR